MRDTWKTLVLHLSAALAVAATAAEAGPKLSKKQLGSLLERTREAYRLDEEMTQPVRVLIHLEPLFDEKAPQGIYQFVATSPTRWRTDLALPGWKEVNLRNEEGVWSWEHPANQNAILLLASQVSVALDGSFVVPWSEDSEARFVGGGSSGVVELRSGEERLRLDSSTGLPVSLSSFALELRFEGWAEAGGRPWPQQFTFTGRQGPLLRGRLIETVVAKDAAQEDHFVPPEGSRRFAGEGVEGLEPPVLISAPPLDLPEQVLRRNLESGVVFRILIGVDGRVKECDLLQGEEPQLVEAARAALEQRRYEPARLEGEPIEMRSTVRVQLRLGAMPRRK